MTAIWPLTLDFDINGTSGGPKLNRLSFGTDSGLPIERPKYTAELEVWNFLTKPMPHVDARGFALWHRTELLHGVNPFILTHPYTGEFGQWKITAVDPPFTFQPVSTFLLVLSFQAMLRPNKVEQADYLINSAGRIEAA